MPPRGGNRIGFTGTFDDQVSSKLTGLRKQFDATAQSPGAKAILMGVGLGAGVTAVNAIGSALGGVIDYASEAVQAGSDLNETLSKSDVVFGKAADGVERFGSTAAESFGLSKRAAIEAAASFGNVFTGVDIGQEKAASMSQTLVKLAGDLASFNNIDPTEALEKLRSGLAGEAEPLRSVGVFLTEAQVKAKAMKLGLADAHGELTEGAKILARYQLILEQTKTAQGDFARTSEGVANTERKLNAEMEDREAQIGQKLIPVEKAWLDVRLELATRSGALISALDAEHHSVDQNLSDLRDLLNIVPGLGDEIAFLARQTTEFTPAQIDAANAAQRLSEKTELAADSTDDLVEAVKGGPRPVNDLTEEVAALDDAMGGAAGTTEKLASALSEELFGKAITAGREAEIRASIRALRDQRDEATKGSPKWAELTGKIAEQQQALFDLHFEQAKGEGPLALLSFLNRERDHFKNADEKARDYLATLMKIAALQATTHGGITFTGVPTGSGKAAGGPVRAGVAYPVNENTPNTEWFMPKQDGWVIPPGGPGPVGGGTVFVNFNSVWPPTPEQARQIAAVIAGQGAWDLATAPLTLRPG